MNFGFRFRRSIMDETVKSLLEIQEDDEAYSSI